MTFVREAIVLIVSLHAIMIYEIIWQFGRK